MITISKQNDGVLFEFEDSKKYLFGDGSILVPFNSLTIIQDESDMITFRKAASNDIFLSARYDTDLGYTSKDEAVTALKELLFAEAGGGTGSGVTSGDVETMIDTALDDYYDKDEVDAGFDSVNATLSGKADTSAVTAVANDVQTVSGQVQTKLATSDFNAYSAATATALGNKQDKLVYYSENTEDGYADMIVTTDDGDGNTTEQRVSIGVGLEIGNYEEYNDGQGNTGYTRTNIQLANPEINIYAESEDNGETESTYFNITPTSVTINGDNVLTDGMISTAITSGSTDSEIPTAKAVYDAIQAGGGGGANVIELTQAQYEELSTIDPDAIYVITDATAYDPSTKVDTSAITSSVTSASTDTQIPTAKAVYDAIPTGGGATYSAGTNISIANDTINCTLPITANSTTFIAGSTNHALTDKKNILIGTTSLFSGINQDSVIIGNNAKGTTDNVVIGRKAIGGSINNYDWYNVAIGSLAFAKGGNHVAIGYNVTASGSTKTNINDQIKVDTNNQVYIKDKTNTTDVCIQDAIAALGGLKFVSLSQSEYDNLPTKDSSTLYIINNVVS